MHVYKDVRLCPSKTYYTLTNDKISLQCLLTTHSYTAIVHCTCEKPTTLTLLLCFRTDIIECT